MHDLLAFELSITNTVYFGFLDALLGFWMDALLGFWMLFPWQLSYFHLLKGNGQLVVKELKNIFVTIS